jgi:hypothetical protein
MSQVLEHEQKPSFPRTRDIAEAIVHRTLSAVFPLLFATLDETVSVTQRPSLRGCVLRFLRRNFFDYFGRR